MKPIVIETKKSDSLPIAYICCTTAPFSRRRRTREVERLREDRVELAPAEEEVDPRGAEVVDDARARDGGRGFGERGSLGATCLPYPRMKLTK